MHTMEVYGALKGCRGAQRKEEERKTRPKTKDKCRIIQENIEKLTKKWKRSKKRAWRYKDGIKTNQCTREMEIEQVCGSCSTRKRKGKKDYMEEGKVNLEELRSSKSPEYKRNNLEEMYCYMDPVGNLRLLRRTFNKELLPEEKEVILNYDRIPHIKREYFNLYARRRGWRALRGSSKRKSVSRPYRKTIIYWKYILGASI